MQSKTFTRDSAGLTEMIFCTMEELRAGLISPKQAGVIAALCQAQLQNVAMGMRAQQLLDRQRERGLLPDFSDNA